MKIKSSASASNAARSGPYVGGIGAGGFEVRADGRFHRCHIWNEWMKENRLDASFYHMDRKGRARILRLDDDVTAGKVISGVRGIKMGSEFPRVKMEFADAGVTVEYRSFFIPGDVKNSSLPAVAVRVRGKGKLAFLLSYPAASFARIKGRAVFLESARGGIGLQSQRGLPISKPAPFKAWAIHQWINWGRINWQGSLRYYGKKGKPVPRFCGLYWENDFNDEFIIAWHNPANRDNTGRDIGHYYSRYFRNAPAVMKYVRGNLRKLDSRTAAFSRTIARARVTEPLRATYESQLSSFVKQTWLARDGRFGVWEGSCVCCGLQTTDVSYYGSWLYLKLFPELEKSGMKLTAKFQRRGDGWIPHFFPGTFTKIDEYRRKDMNMQFALMTYRDYLAWKDEGFLRAMWPHMKRAIVGVYGWDKDGDGIPEVEPAAQTFDCWGFSGLSSFIAILWLAALKVGAETARKMGDQSSAWKWERDADRVRARVIGTLWNGRWFDLAVDGKKRDICCMLDTLSGDWYCRLMGMGGLLPDPMVKSHLKWCLRLCRKPMDAGYMRHYFTPGEKGYCYINGGYPDGRRVGFQQFEPWTGIEYSFATHLLLMGMRADAMRVVKDVHDRKVACGMVWNHIECGGDYFRPMMIGGVWDLVHGRLPLKPA